jgi:hypothetical protein
MIRRPGRLGASSYGSPGASDPDLAKALWARSEELNGVRFAL